MKRERETYQCTLSHANTHKTAQPIKPTTTSTWLRNKNLELVGHEMTRTEVEEATIVFKQKEWIFGYLQKWQLCTWPIYPCGTAKSYGVRVTGEEAGASNLK
jgi:hypothetical protein